MAPRCRALCAALLAACNSHAAFPYAAVDAASFDALPTSADAAQGAVSVTVTLRGAPAPGAPVYFQDADSTLVLAAATDDHGTASAVLADGGYVTVIEPDDGSAAIRLATFSATRAGDALHLDVAPAGPFDATTLAVSVPTDTKATSYLVDTSCGQLVADASGTASGGLSGCGDAVDLIVLEVDLTGSIAGSLYAAGVPVSAEPATVTGSYRALAPTSFTYTSVPAASTAVSTLQRLMTARGVLYDAFTSAVPSAGAATSSLDMPDASGAIALTVSEAPPASADHGEQQVFDWGAPGSYTLDFAAALLPPFATAPTYDVTARRVSWAEGTGATEANLVRARVHAFRDGLPEGKSWTWWLVGARGGTASVAFPRFPAGGFDFTPQAGDAVDVDDLLTASVPGGYDSVRAHGFAPVRTYVTGSSGRLVVETLPTPQM